MSENPVKRKSGIMEMITAFLFAKLSMNVSTYHGSFGRTSGYNMNYNNIMKAKIKNKRRR